MPDIGIHSERIQAVCLSRCFNFVYVEGRRSEKRLVARATGEVIALWQESLREGWPVVWGHTRYSAKGILAITFNR